MLGAFFTLDVPIFNGLAISLIFGILVSSVLTLVVIPLLYYVAYRRNPAALPLTLYRGPYRLGGQLCYRSNQRLANGGLTRRQDHQEVTEDLAEPGVPGHDQPAAVAGPGVDDNQAIRRASLERQRVQAHPQPCRPVMNDQDRSDRDGTRSQTRCARLRRRRGFPAGGTRRSYRHRIRDSPAQ